MGIISRQKFLQWAGLGGVGLAIVVVGREIFNCQSSSASGSTITTPITTTTNQSILRITDQPTTISVAEPRYIFPNEGTPQVFGLPLWTVEFETVTVDRRGQVIKRDPNKQAKFFKEDLGDGVTLEMVSIPGGSFKMGSPSIRFGLKLSRINYRESKSLIFDTSSFM